MVKVVSCLLKSPWETEPEAAGAGHKDIVSALRLSKANVDAVDEYGNTVRWDRTGILRWFFVSCHGSCFPKFGQELVVNHVMATCVVSNQQMIVPKGLSVARWERD